MLVVDTNVIVSALIFPGRLPSQALNKGLKRYKLAISAEVRAEYREVLARKKFEPFISLEQRRRLLEKLLLRSEIFVAKETVKVCRDPKDDMFLELALSAQAECIISGDPHLLELHPFRGIPILKAADFLIKF